MKPITTKRLRDSVTGRYLPKPGSRQPTANKNAIGANVARPKPAYRPKSGRNGATKPVEASLPVRQNKSKGKGKALKSKVIGRVGPLQMVHVPSLIPVWRLFNEALFRDFIHEASEEGNWPLFIKLMRAYLRATPAKPFVAPLGWAWDGEQWKSINEKGAHQ